MKAMSGLHRTKPFPILNNRTEKDSTSYHTIHNISLIYLYIHQKEQIKKKCKGSVGILKTELLILF